MKLKTRITADLDNTSMLAARIRTFLVCKWLYEKDVIIDKKELRLSSSKKGVHVILWTSNKLNNKAVFFIRELLGDDIRRLEIDKSRRRPRQYLFKTKKLLANNGK